MIAYNTLWVSNLFNRQQAQQAFEQECLDKEELDNINTRYPAPFYSPNLFIRIGLFILTTVILLFSFGLLALLFLQSIDDAIGGLTIFFALLCYVALEYMVQSKKHFQSGVDDALLWIFACSLLGGISYLVKAGNLANCILICIISLYCSLRFADRLMSVVLYVSFLGIFFFSCIHLGAAAKAFVPFVIMAISALIYLLISKAKGLKTNQLYAGCLLVISISALISFYISGNYYVVRELSNAMFNLNLAENESIPFAWLFWLFTVAIPCLYIIRGIQKKEIIFIRVGLILMACIVFTVRYYYSIAPPEVIMAAGGIVLMLVSYGLSRYLKTPRYGFTNLEIASTDTPGKLQIESILVTQTFTGQPAPADGTKFGGGGFGGGGASGEF